MKRLFALFFIPFFLGLIVDSSHAKGLVSDKMEVSVGSSYHRKMIEDNGGEWYNPAVSTHVKEMGQRIVSVSDRTNIPYQFTLVNNDAFNATSLPGGYIYINRGAIMRLKNDAQLAALLGHEVAHVAKRHCASLLEQEMGLNMLLGVVGWIADQKSDDDRKKIQSITKVGTTVFRVAQLGYGREKELEADQYGAEYAARAGYDPGGMLQLLRILQQKEGSGSSEFTEIFQSHPAPSKRIAKIEEYLNEAYASSDAAGYKGNYFPEEYTTTIVTTPQGDQAYAHYELGRKFAQKGVYDLAILKFQQALESDPKFADAYDALGTVLLKQGYYDEAIEDFNKAIRYGQKALYYNNLGAAYYYKEEFDNAISCFERAVEISPTYSQAYANMAENYRCKKEYVKATGFAEKAVRLESDNFFAHSVLALIYEERGWIDDAAREYQVLLESPEYQKSAREKLSSLRRM